MYTIFQKDGQVKTFSCQEDFLHAASVLIGAVYVSISDAIRRLSQEGHKVESK